MRSLNKWTQSGGRLPKKIELTLPEPPSINAYYRSIVIKGQVRVLLSAEGRAYKQDVLAHWLRRPPAQRKALEGPLAVHLAWHRARKVGDTDNRSKAVLDSLNGLAWMDDKQIVDLRITRHESPRNGRLDLTIEAIE